MGRSSIAVAFLLVSVLPLSTGLAATGLAIRVTDQSGERIVGAAVALVAGGQTVARGQTGETGEVLFDVEPGRYRAEVSAKGYVARTSFVVAAGEAAGAVVSVRLFPGGTLRGAVVDSRGRPVADAEWCLTLVDRGRLPAEALGDALFTDGRHCATSDARGNVASAVLPLGRYELSIEAADRVPIRASLDLDRDRDGARWTLRTGGRVTGRVLQPDDRPVVGAVVRLSHRELGLAREGATDDEGAFVVAGLAPGAWSLRVEPPSAGAIRRDGVDVDEGGTAALGTLRTYRGLDVSGTVVDPDGAPVQGARFQVRDGERLNRLLREAESGDDGSFLVAGLGEDPVNLIVDPPDGFAATALEDVTPPDRSLEIELERTGEVCGSVTDEDGAVPSGVRVSAAPEGSDLIFRYDKLVRSGTDAVDAADGRFCLSSVHPGKGIAVTATAPGYLRASVDVTVPPGGSATPVELVLERGLGVAGRVTGEGLPVAGAAVRVDGSAAVSTDTFGEFRLSGLEPGARRFVVSHVDFATTRHDVVLPLPDDQPLVIEMGRGGTVEGTVRRSTGEPVPGIRIALRATDDECLTDEDGFYRFEHAPAGETTVSRRARGNWDDFEDRRVEVVSGQTSTVDFTVGEVLEGQVLRGGVPLPGAYLALARPDRADEFTSGSHSVQSTWSDETGRYRLAGVRTGWATLTVEIGTNRVIRPVEIPAGASPRLDVVLPDRRMAGRVVADLDDRPLGGAQVHAELAAVGGAPESNGSSSYSSSTAEGGVRFNLTTAATSETVAGPDGSFELYVESLPRVAIGAWALGYRSIQETFAPDDDVELRLPRSVELVVHIRDEHGRELDDVRACALRQDANSSSCVSGGSAKVNLSLDEGTYVLLASARGFGTEELVRELRADAAGPTEIDVALAPGAPLRIRLVGQTNATPVVTLIDPFGVSHPRLVQEESVDPATGDRRWTTWPLDPGLWIVAIDVDGTPLSREVEVVPGPEIEVTLP